MRLLFATATSLLMTANMAIANPMGFLPDGIIIDGEIQLSYIISDLEGGDRYFVDLSLGYEFPLAGDVAIGLGFRTFGLAALGSSTFDYAPFIYADFGSARVSYGGVKNATAHIFEEFDIFSSGIPPFAIYIFTNLADSRDYNATSETLHLDAQFGRLDVSISTDFDFDISAIAGRYRVNQNLDVFAGVTVSFGDQVYILGGKYTHGQLGLSAIYQKFPSLAMMSARVDYAVNDQLSLSAATLFMFNNGPITARELAVHYAFNDVMALSTSWLTLSTGSYGSIDLSSKF